MVFFLSYGTLVDFVKAIDCSVFRYKDCCFGMLAVTVKFVISLHQKRYDIIYALKI